MQTLAKAGQWSYTDTNPAQTHSQGVTLNSTPTPKHNGNGHRRRELRRRVLAEEHVCALCGEPVDKSLTYRTDKHGPKCRGIDQCRGCIPHPRRPEVDEDIPRSRGGSPYDRSNCRLMHRECNAWKSAMTLREAIAKRVGTQQQKQALKVIASPIW